MEPSSPNSSKSISRPQFPASRFQSLCNAVKGDIPLTEVKKKVEDSDKLVLERVVISLTGSWRRLRDELRRKEIEAKSLKDLNHDWEQVVTQQKEAGDFLVSEIENVAVKAEEMNEALNSANVREQQLKDKICSLEGEKVALKVQLSSLSLELQAALSTLQESEDALVDALNGDLKGKLNAALDPILSREHRLQKLILKLLAAQDAVTDPLVSQVPTLLLKWVQDRLSKDEQVNGSIVPRSVITKTGQGEGIKRKEKQQMINRLGVKLQGEDDSRKTKADGCHSLTLSHASLSNNECYSLEDLVSTFPFLDSMQSPVSDHSVNHTTQVHTSLGTEVPLVGELSVGCKEDAQMSDGLELHEVGTETRNRIRAYEGSNGNKDFIHAGVEAVVEELKAAIDVLHGSRGLFGMTMRIPFALTHLYFGLGWRIVTSTTVYTLSFIESYISASQYMFRFQ